MFSTFTGSSKRPRNVNLSGQVSNPFSNTSWSPSVVSNATKTVSDAQADRERRQAERQRLKAAAKIQKTWRGYRTRSSLKELQRAEFDDIYKSSTESSATGRVALAFKPILSFFTARRADDLRRLSHFIRDYDTILAQQLKEPSTLNGRLKKLMDILVQASGVLISEANESAELPQLLSLITRIITQVPETITTSIKLYYTMLAQLCRTREGRRWSEILVQCLSAPLTTASNTERTQLRAYKALAFSLLTQRDIKLFEDNISIISQVVDIEKLAIGVVEGYSTAPEELVGKDDRLWLLAHFIDLSRAQVESPRQSVYLDALFTQVSSLSSEINARLSLQPMVGHINDVTEESLAQALAPYICRQLLSLVDQNGISQLLKHFSENLAMSSNQEFHRAGLLAGYILALLQSFPSNADDTRMRLFLEQIPTTSGHTPIVKFLWQIMQKTSVFNKLRTESARPVDVLRRYLRGISSLSQETVEDQEWRIALLFLELYTFILRLSDDEDFFSGIHPLVATNSLAVSRIRSCSLSLGDVKSLTTFLKNTGFALHYNVQEITQSHQAVDESTKARLEVLLASEQTQHGIHGSREVDTTTLLQTSTKLDLESLRAIITTALKMLYERDSRKRFLPQDHWLMTEKLDKEDFVGAVIAEEERQNQEQAEESDEETRANGENPNSDDTGFYSTLAGQRVFRHARLERLKSRQMRAIRERRLAEMGPKLEILKHMPFVVPFETRVMIFRQFIHLDRIRRDGNTGVPVHPFARHHGRIRRGQLFEDAFKEFYKLGEGLKDSIQITFVDQFDTPEAGIDGGGVTKEFLTSVTSEAFGVEDGGFGMFTSNEKGLLYPNPIAVDALRQSLHREGFSDSDIEWGESMTNLVQRFEFLGRIVGKCMYEGILVDLAFAGFFLLKWPSPGPKDENSYKGSVNDLQDMDEELYNGLLQLKNYSGDVSALGFDFTVTDQVSRPGEPVETVTRKLVSNGDQTPVTNDNRLLYISYAARHRLVVQPALQTGAFLRGLRDIIRPSWLSMFNQSELQRLVGGDSSEIDIEDLRHNTVYSGLYVIGDDQQEHPTIKMFWRVMAGFTDAQRRDVLKYVSSTPRAPLLGFSQLRPKFSIRDGGTDEERLPSTSTCVNLLKLPRYTRESTLRKKLLYAISSGAGFDLS